jgi:hypothetical protein
MFEKNFEKYPWLAEFQIISEGFVTSIKPIPPPRKPQKPLDDEFHFPSLHHKRFHRWEMARVDKFIKGLESQFKGE